MTKIYIKSKEGLLSLENPLVMGILNITSDSFYDGGKYNTIDKAIYRVEEMLEEGVDIIDVGGQSTRPGASLLYQDSELRNVLPIIKNIRKRFPQVCLSIDTFWAKVAQECVDAGADIINDISGGNFDTNMYSTVAKLQVPYILMHIQGTPQTMQQNPQYNDVVIDVNHYLSQKIKKLKDLGVNDIILDPGFGFGKTTEHNYELLKHLSIIGYGEYPILIGLSNKSMVYKYLDINKQESLHANSALHLFALQNGANILRVHEVKEAKQMIKLYKQLKTIKSKNII